VKRGFFKNNKILIRTLNFQTRTLLCFVLILAVSCVFAFATVSTAASKNKKAVNEYSSPSYVIGPEDVLDISVWKNADLSKTVIVRPDGNISLPLIGDVRAMGYTPFELRQLLVKKFGEYEQSVVVSVIVQAINSYKVFIFGDVNSPGLYTLKRQTSLLQVIALAGGFNKFASKNDIILLREKAGGGNLRFKVRFNDIVYGKAFARNNIILKPGDTIFVP